MADCSDFAPTFSLHPAWMSVSVLSVKAEDLSNFYFLRCVWICVCAHHVDAGL